MAVCKLIQVHNYNDLIKQRDDLLLRKQGFYTKYFTQDDNEVWEMITDEDLYTWDKLLMRLLWVDRLIKKWETTSS